MSLYAKVSDGRYTPARAAVPTSTPFNGSASPQEESKPGAPKNVHCDERYIETWFENSANRNHLIAQTQRKYRGRDDIEDIIQETALKAINYVRKHGGSCYFSCQVSTWFATIANRIIIDKWRADKQRRLYEVSEWDILVNGETPTKSPLQEVADKTSPTIDSLIARQRLEIIGNALSTMSPDLRNALVLRDVMDLSYKDISDRMNLPEGTVKSRINRGRNILAQSLGI